MKNAYIVLLVMFFLCFVGCLPEKNSSGSLINATNAGADVFLSSNTVTGFNLSGMIVKILEQFDKSIVQVDEVSIMKSYPKGKYLKTIKKYNGKELESMSIEEVFPVESKPNNLPFYIMGGVIVFGILCNLLVKLIKK